MIQISRFSIEAMYPILLVICVKMFKPLMLKTTCSKNTLENIIIHVTLIFFKVFFLSN